MSSVTECRLRANGLAFTLAEAGDGPPVLARPERLDELLVEFLGELAARWAPRWWPR